MIDDNSSIILPGIIASFSSLKKRLLKKFDQDTKERKKNKNIINTSTPLTSLTTNQSKTNDELTNHIIKSIDQWIYKYRNDFDLPANISLVNTVDYSVEFKDDRAGQQLVIITCVCGSKIPL